MMVTEFGMSDLGPIQYESNTGSVFLGRDYTNTQKNFSTQVAFEIDKAVRQIIDEAHERAEKLLLEHKDQVILVAETLLDIETITAEQIESLVKNGKLPEAPAKEEEKPAEEAKVEEKPVEVAAEEKPVEAEAEEKPAEVKAEEPEAKPAAEEKPAAKKTSKPKKEE